MRYALLLLFLIGGIRACAIAQEQEPKLIDRLLRPNTALQSKEQNKKFVGRDLSESKQARVHEFYIRDHTLAKNFTGDRAFVTRSADTTSFKPERATAFIGSRNKVPGSKFQTNPSRFGALAYDTKRESKQREFQTTKFESRGKSQKSLSAQSRPMTIDEVRDLLNKSK